MIIFWVFMNQQDGVFIYFYSSLVLKIRKLKYDLTLKTMLAGIVNEVPQTWGRIICTVITVFACMPLWLKVSQTLNQRTKDKPSLPEQFLMFLTVIIPSTRFSSDKTRNIQNIIFLFISVYYLYIQINLFKHIYSKMCCQGYPFEIITLKTLQ